MAIYHCSVKMIGRSSGRSSVASSAYRSGEKLTNQRDGITHDYTGKKGIVYSEIITPKNAPDWAHDRETLWNEVEKVEKSSKAQLAREVEIALPNELPRENQISLCHEYAQQFAKDGMVVDYSIHDKLDGNPHAHIMLTTRPFDDQGNWGAKQRKVYELDGEGKKQYNSKTKTYKCRSEPTTDWNKKETLQKWRIGWEKTANRALEKAGIEQRIDHRSNQERGIERTPTIHEGVHARAMEKKGIVTERGEANRKIRRRNRAISAIEAQLNARAKERLEIRAKAKAMTVRPLPKTTESRLSELYYARERVWEYQERDKALRHDDLKAVSPDQARKQATEKVIGQEMNARQKRIETAQKGLDEAKGNLYRAEVRENKWRASRRPDGVMDKLTGRTARHDRAIEQAAEQTVQARTGVTKAENRLQAEKQGYADMMAKAEPAIQKEQQAILDKSDNKKIAELKEIGIDHKLSRQVEKIIDGEIKALEDKLSRKPEKIHELKEAARKRSHAVTLKEKAQPRKKDLAERVKENRQAFLRAGKRVCDIGQDIALERRLAKSPVKAKNRAKQQNKGDWELHPVKPLKPEQELQRQMRQKLDGMKPRQGHSMGYER